MKENNQDDLGLDARIAARLKALRSERGWSLDVLAERCGVSRATLSRLENGDVSPTATVLGKLCSAYGLPLSQLMAMVETAFEPLVPHDGQTVWVDPETGFQRRSVSPPSQSLAAEMLDCALPPDTCLDYARPPRPGLEHHLFLLEGSLEMTVEDEKFKLEAGDCLRYRLHGSNRFRTGPDKPARYVLVMV